MIYCNKNNIFIINYFNFFGFIHLIAFYLTIILKKFNNKWKYKKHKIFDNQLNQMVLLQQIKIFKQQGNEIDIALYIRYFNQLENFFLNFGNNCTLKIYCTLYLN